MMSKDLNIFFLLTSIAYFVLLHIALTCMQGCALRKISGSPLGSQAFYLSRPGLKVGRPNKNFGEPFGLPSIPAGVPRPLKLVARVHLMRKYFVRTQILLACWSPNSVILAFGFVKNLHVVLWNPSKFSCHSDFKPKTLAMPPNGSGFKEGKAKISAGLRKLH